MPPEPSLNYEIVNYKQKTMLIKPFLDFFGCRRNLHVRPWPLGCVLGTEPFVLACRRRIFPTITHTMAVATRRRAWRGSSVIITHRTLTRWCKKPWSSGSRDGAAGTNLSNQPVCVQRLSPTELQFAEHVRRGVECEVAQMAQQNPRTVDIDTTINTVIFTAAPSRSYIQNWAH